MAALISSRHNPLIRDLRARLKLPSRRSGICALEGWRLLGAAAAAGVRFDLLLLTERAAEDPGDESVRATVRARAAREVTVTPDVFDALTRVPSPQGALAIAARPEEIPLGPHLDAGTFAVVLDGIQDPGNAGTIVRTAVACGVTVVVTCGPAVDPFGPKAIRASAGAVFRVPVASVESPDDAARCFRAAGVRMVAGDVHAAELARPVDLRRPLALILGGEAGGPAAAWREHGAVSVRVPIAGPVESLNVAAAAAVLLYEAAGLARGVFDGRA